MKTYSNKTKTFKLLKALKNGDHVSQSEASKRFGIKNIRAEATRIRYSGYVVNATRRLAGNHVEVTEYTLGNPSREMIAAAYLARRVGIVASI